MPGVTHDLFVRHTVAVGSCDESGTQAVRAERFGKRASQLGLGSSLQKDLAHRVSAQPGPFDNATAVDLAEQRAGDNFGEFQPGFEGGNWAGVACPTLGNGNLGAFTLRVRLGTLDEQLQAAPGPGHVFNIQPDEFGTAQRAREAEEKHCLVAGASEIWSAGPAQLADLGRGDGC
jgi:hypothetical protein